MPHVTPQGEYFPACAVYGVSGCDSAPARWSAPQPSLHGHARELCSTDTDEEVVPAAAHPWEKPLLALCVAVSVGLLAVALRFVWSVSGSVPWTALALFTAPLTCWSVRGLRYARERAESVRISPTQFPEAYRMVVSLSADMGLARAPEAYVRLGPVSARADAAAHGLRRYLVLPDALFDGGGRLRDPDALAFLIAHQIGHVAAGHTGYWRRVATLGAELLPGLGAALSRAAEYTADNHAHAHLPEGTHAVRLFAGGPNLYTRVNMGEMAARASTDRGCSLLLYHLLSRRPSNTRRMAALRDRTRRGRVFL
ncbi:M48 family metallopeptidase [Nocardiopsis exhalans]|uniref:M48 family metallopeptidase n=1 Tax=Nocardiopsis exhalans TaxID=163604 RepID=A0ABY5D655_9ACTN|nr:M48 family metallopeptidase [Nocardiopsis exhalans]USY19814.1 M48 family metallopeptidase [Nocardiopsis exhalans]